jgi:hypothetical protein
VWNKKRRKKKKLFFVVLSAPLFELEKGREGNKKGRGCQINSQKKTIMVIKTGELVLWI